MVSSCFWYFSMAFSQSTIRVHAGLLGLEVGDLALQRLDLGRQLTAELDDAVDFGIRFLEVVEGLELFLDAQVGIGEVLLEGNEGFPLVDRGFDFFDLLSCCHMVLNNILSARVHQRQCTGLLSASRALMRTAKVGKIFRSSENKMDTISTSPSKWPMSATMKPSGVKKWW